MNVPPFLVGLGVMAAGVVAGAILLVLDFALIGIVDRPRGHPVGPRRLGRGRRPLRRPRCSSRASASGSRRFVPTVGR